MEKFKLSPAIILLSAALFFAVSFLYADDPFKITFSQLDIKNKGNKTYTLDFSVSYASGLPLLADQPEMCILDEKYLITGSIENNTINERDFLFSQKDIDLNGDGDFNDSFKMNV